jgi:hypothetical protein
MKDLWNQMMNLNSSYKKNNYGSVLRALILARQPKKVVECGILDGYSTFHIARAVRFNIRKRKIKSIFYAYDIFEKYEYKHGDYDKVQSMLEEQGLEPYCRIVECDAFRAAWAHRTYGVDFLHFDISNDGDILLKMLETWGDKITYDGMIAFEGGSQERDEGWIKKYNKRPIRHELINNPYVYKNWDIQIFDEHPSLTLLFPRRI